MTDIQDTPIEVTDANVDQLLEQQRQEEAPAEAKHEEPAEKKHDGPEPKVPLGALHEERMRRKALEAEKSQLAKELEENRRWRQENEQILAERLAALQQKQQIDPAENPVGYLATQQQETQKMLAEMQENQRKQNEQYQQNVAMQQFAIHVQRDEEAFISKTPDYSQAAQHAREFKEKEYMTFGFTPEQAKEQVDRDAIAIAQRALQLGESPANLFYQYAVNVAKYQPQVNGEQKLNMMEAGQKASKPSGGSGKSPTLTLETLASMSSEEFARATSDEDAFRRLMGG